MNLKQVIKYSVLGTFALALLLSALAFAYLRSVGFFLEPKYDHAAPTIPSLSTPAILVLHKTNGFIHKEGLPAATAMLADLAAKNEWSIYQTDNAATHNTEQLTRFDVVVWNNTSGDILTEKQRIDFRAWIESGGSWMGLHAAGGDRDYDWAWYRDQVLRTQFFGHTMSPQFQDADLLTVSDSNLISHLPSPWNVSNEEWYAFKSNPRQKGSEILLTLDENSYDTSETFFAEPTMPGEHPIAWTHKINAGSVIYSGIGHQAHTYKNEHFVRFVEKSLRQLISANSHE